MKESEYGSQNTVRTEKQLTGDNPVAVYDNNGKIKILFAGNSITYHAPLAEIGWSGSWGMAATSKENDFVHRF